jgi:hypothetical protein
MQCALGPIGQLGQCPKRAAQWVLASYVVEQVSSTEPVVPRNCGVLSQQGASRRSEDSFASFLVYLTAQLQAKVRPPSRSGIRPFWATSSRTLAKEPLPVGPAAPPQHRAALGVGAFELGGQFGLRGLSPASGRRVQGRCLYVPRRLHCHPIPDAGGLGDEERGDRPREQANSAREAVCGDPLRLRTEAGLADTSALWVGDRGKGFGDSTIGASNRAFRDLNAEFCGIGFTCSLPLVGSNVGAARWGFAMTEGFTRHVQFTVHRFIVQR